MDDNYSISSDHIPRHVHASFSLSTEHEYDNYSKCMTNTKKDNLSNFDGSQCSCATSREAGAGLQSKSGNTDAGRMKGAANSTPDGRLHNPYEIGMGGICCRQIDIMMTGIALNRRPAKTIVHMTLQAWNCIVRPSSGELRLIVIKARLP